MTWHAPSGHGTSVDGQQVDVAIVGAGIAGLTLGSLLRTGGLSVAVLEQAPRAGGTIQTSAVDGFLLERGANSTLATPELLNLTASLGLADELLPASPAAKKRYLVTDRNAQQQLVLAAAPTSISAAIRSPLLSAPAKLRVFREPFVRRGSGSDETVAEFFSRRFGPEVSERIVAAVLSGIWAGDIGRLSARCAVRKAWEAEQEFGSVLLGLMRRKKTAPQQAGGLRGSISLRRGMESLPVRIAEQFRAEELQLGTTVEAIVPGDDGRIDLRLIRQSGAADRPADLIRARQVVITGSASQSAELLRHVAPALARTIENIPYAPVGLLYITAPLSAIEHPLDGFGLLVPPCFGTALRGALFSSTLFPGRAPEGQALITCFTGGATCPQASDARDPLIQTRIVKELSPLLGFRNPPAILGAHSWPRAIPNFPLGHHTLQLAIDDLHQSDSRVAVLANWDRGISVADRVSEATKMSELLLQRLASGPASQRAVS